MGQLANDWTLSEELESRNSVLNLESYAQAQLKTSTSLEGTRGQQPISFLHFK